jgi:hypothetical protein
MDYPTIQELAAFANSQQEKNRSTFAKNMYPWKALCEQDDYLHYVARSQTGIICGWLAASLKQFKSERYISVMKISTRRIRNSLYGGVGQALHNALVHDALERGCNFLYLFPLDADVRTIYMKPEWGYVSLSPDIPILFRILKKPPSPKLLATFAPRTSQDIVARALRIAGRNMRLREQIQTVGPRFSPETMEELDQHMDLMDVMELSANERRTELSEFFAATFVETPRRS